MSDPCIICGTNESNRVYQGPVRAGRFGSLTSKLFAVLRCHGCGSDRLSPRTFGETEYETGTYRETVDGQSEAEAYYANHDAELAGRLNLIGSRKLRGTVAVDVGCGAGTFLDLLTGLAAETIGVEPQASFAPVLEARGHRRYSYPADAAAAEPERADVAFAFQVIEHVVDPRQFLMDIAGILKPAGELHLTTPNRDDILMHLGGDDYRRFFYRLVHNWYFDTHSLARTAAAAGLHVRIINTPHQYDLSNFAVWLRDRRPSGLGSLDALGGVADAAFQRHVAQTGRGNLIYAVLTKD